MRRPLETVTRVRPVASRPGRLPADASWAERWDDAASQAGFSEDARRVISLDARYIAERGVLAPDVGAVPWPASGLRRGLVFGAVQSGKTASMLALSALLLDGGVNVLVILAGTRIALWRQTLERALEQLDHWTPAEDSLRRRARIWLPRPATLLEAQSLPPLSLLYDEHPNLVVRRLVLGRPMIAVVMKQADHLAHFGKYLRSVVESATPRLSEPLRLVVIDDEADDGSILDAGLETELFAAHNRLQRQLPGHIARLWAGLGRPHETFTENLRATYVAYTATPQANVLQADHNPLAPSDFVAALRTPADRGYIEPPRDVSYAERSGVHRFYCGGELFYRQLRGSAGELCVPWDLPTRREDEPESSYLERVALSSRELLSNALRAYFVAGAMRLVMTGRRLSALPGSEDGVPLSELNELLPEPHSMLIHPSSLVAQHFITAEDVAAWSAEIPATEVASADEPPRLDAEGLAARLATEEAEWRRWLPAYRASARLLSTMPGALYDLPSEDQWQLVRDALVNEVFPHTRLAVINSDPRADDRPAYRPVPVTGSLHRPPRDIYTIFVSGNVMSRGLTLDGLCTSLFIRTANDPAADTQMQMQRWFGYRGSHLPFCRVFLYSDQLELFTAYHENDQAMRQEVIAGMNQSRDTAPSPLVLGGRRFVATRKVSNLGSIPLHPGASPFVRLIEIHDEERRRHNCQILADLLDDSTWQELSVLGTTRGLIRPTPVRMREVANLLDRFLYSHHDPDPSEEEHAHWEALERQLNLDEDEVPLFRPPGQLEGRPTAVRRRYCPYSIAAYLRTWASALTRHARGLVPTDAPDMPWSFVNLDEYRATAPTFYLGVRFGGAGLTSEPALRQHGIHAMERQVEGGYVHTTWGSRGVAGTDVSETSPGYLGDQLFDYHHHGRPAPPVGLGEPGWRPRGDPGLVLFQLVRLPGAGHDSLTLGLSIPCGGPDHMAVLRARGR